MIALHAAKLGRSAARSGSVGHARTTLPKVVHVYGTLGAEREGFIHATAVR